MGETEVCEKPCRGAAQPSSRRPKSAGLDADLTYFVDAPFQRPGLVGGAEIRPVFVAPAVEAKFVSGVGYLE
jgi:hypothetical protein